MTLCPSSVEFMYLVFLKSTWPHTVVLPLPATMYTDQLITRSSLDIHSVYTPRFYLLLVWTSGHGKYSWLQNLCLLFECTLNSTDFHIPVSSILQSSFCQQCFPSDNIHTIVYWWPSFCRISRRCIWTSGGEAEISATELQPFSFLHEGQSPLKHKIQRKLRNKPLNSLIIQS